jgi:tRNA 2-thiouridine synthesizing protein A
VPAGTSAAGAEAPAPEHEVVMQTDASPTHRFDREIDTRGLNCPLPILRAKKALAEMASGEVLRVVATDPGSMRDFQAFARQTGNELLGQETAGKEFNHYLKRR